MNQLLVGTTRSSETMSPYGYSTVSSKKATTASRSSLIEITTGTAPRSECRS